MSETEDQRGTGAREERPNGRPISDYPLFQTHQPYKVKFALDSLTLFFFG